MQGYTNDRGFSSTWLTLISQYLTVAGLSADLWLQLEA